MVILQVKYLNALFVMVKQKFIVELQVIIGQLKTGMMVKLKNIRCVDYMMLIALKNLIQKKLKMEYYFLELRLALIAKWLKKC